MLVISGLGVGGAERVVVDLADAYAARGHEVSLVSLSTPAAVQPTNAAVRLMQLNMTRSLVGLIGGTYEVARLVRLLRPDVVHSHMVHANLLMRALRLMVPIPKLVSTAHTVNEEGKLRMLAYRLTDGLADASTNVSQEAVEAFEKAGAVPPGRMIAIHNGIRVQDWAFSAHARARVRADLGVPDTSKLLLAVGRLAPRKDYPNMLQAVAKLDSSVPWKLVIAGDGPLLRDLEARVQDLGLCERVRFLGVRQDIPALLSAADVFVLSSAWEGFPMVIGEAMACERVVVATDSGGVAEFLGTSEFLVPPGDSIALSDAIFRAMSLSPPRSALHGQSARARVAEHFSHDRAVDKWLKLYTEGTFDVRAAAGNLP